MNFRDWWRQHRKEWPQKKIAHELEVTAGAVQRWVKEERTPKDPDIAKITEISEGDVCVLDFFPLSATALEVVDEEKQKKATNQGKTNESKQQAVGGSVPVKRGAK